MRQCVCVVLDDVRAAEKLEELEQHPEALDVGTDSFDDDDPYDPMEFIDEDDEF